MVDYLHILHKSNLLLALERSAAPPPPCDAVHSALYAYYLVLSFFQAMLNEYKPEVYWELRMRMRSRAHQ